MELLHDIKISLLSLLFCLVIPVMSNSQLDSGDINWWCDQTPHPEPCKYFTSHSHNHPLPQNRFDFRKIMVQVTMERALMAQKQVLRFRPKRNNKRQKAVRADCLKLHDNTILQLNRSLDGIAGVNQTCSDFDIQTWLSTALTNIETCRLGSRDLNVLDTMITPATSTNLSRLISDSLAVNGALLGSEDEDVPSGGEEFPGWVSTKDRKLLQSSSIRPNLVVAKDGSGHFRTVQAAINVAARRRSMSTRFVIYVKRGVYVENIEVGINNNNVMLIGDGIRYTIISSSRSVRGGYTTYSSATAGIDGLRFIARGITFRNGAGPYKGQAVALRSASDLAVFYRCGFEGYQDTLFVHSQRQFFRECYIYGTIDFIFGNAAVVFQSCIIYVRRPLRGQANVITAQGRNDPYQNTGISIQNSRVMASAELRPVVRAFKTYLGRPWQQYSRTVYMKTYLDSLVSPFGWSTWDGSDYALNTLYYGEYKNFGPRASTRYRVRWKGFHVITSAAVASRFTVNSLIAGKSWLPSTGIPFASGL
ncbi:probable pectinesterase/pectinesterase inhibitor 60 [Punica granatum]|uniref:Pectinesterase n=2 Tax=Punica granatum TaxID=22663 RepID=A0A6P8DAZ9_PUNGR|nr:probable pectinesterase/pectinesterase inhibitor 60 [Punica granatum]